MWKYILKRLITVIPVLIGVTFIVYFILSMAPGDPVRVVLGEQSTPEAYAAMKEQLGLNDPVIVQWARYVMNICRGEFGMSYKTKTDVSIELLARIPATLKLSMAATIVSVSIAIPLGMLAAVKQNTWIDGLSMFISLLGVSIPIFWFGLLLLQLFCLKLDWFPPSGTDTWKNFVLPGMALGFHSMASIARITRSSMLEVIRQDYIRTARSKGVPYGTVIRKHALRNALIPTITVTGLQIGSLLAGSVLTETVFGIPGIGRYMIQSIQGLDYPAVLGCIIVFTLTFSIINLVVDLLYAFVDPRIRAQYS